MTYIDIDVLSNGNLKSQYQIDFEKNISCIDGAIILGDLSVSGSTSFGMPYLQFKGNKIFLNRTLNITASAGQDIIISNGLKIRDNKIFLGPNYVPPVEKTLNINLGVDLGGTIFYKNDRTIGGYTARFGDSGFMVGPNSVPPGLLSVDGTFFANPLYFNGTNVGIGTLSPTSPITIRGSLAGEIGALITDPTALINSTRGNTEVSVWQFIGQYSSNSQAFTNWDTYAQGILFTNGAAASNKHWFISPTHDGVPELETGIVTDRIYFCYLDNTTTAPVATMAGVNTYVIGWLPADNSGHVPAGAIDFTGQHRCAPFEEELSSYSDKVGLIVVSTGIYSETIDIKDLDNTTISINEALPKVKLSNIRNDKKVFGVISDKEDESDQQRSVNSGRWHSSIPKKLNDHRLIINSVGEGAIWVTNINGNLENGDYITSCEIPGYGMKQDAHNIKNYTVAKITCDCDFNLNSGIYKCEEFQFSGSTYRRAFVGCTYHCG